MYINSAINSLGAFSGANNAISKSRGNGMQFDEYVMKEFQKSAPVFPEGEDVTMGHPPTHYTNYGVDMNKPKDEMTLDEYKQYICNIVSSLPVSSSIRACASGALIIKEEAFVNMKKDPEYEKYVINMLREDFSVQLPGNAAVASYQVIGGTKEACHGYAGPVNSKSESSASSKNEKSWWEERMERMEELLKEQTETAQERAREQRTLDERNLISSKLESQQRLRKFYTKRAQTGQESMNSAVFQKTIGMSIHAATAYEDNISTFTEMSNAGHSVSSQQAPSADRGINSKA